MLLWGLSGITGDEMGYALVCFYILAPATELLGGFSLGKRSGNWFKWLFPLTGLLNWGTSAIVFGGRFIRSEFIMLTIMAAAPALFGLIAGTIATKRNPNTEVDKMSVKDLR